MQALAEKDVSVAVEPTIVEKDEWGCGLSTSHKARGVHTIVK